MKIHHTLLYLMLAWICMSNAPLAHGQRAILVVRHAERIEYETAHGLLSEAGLARARRLANVLKDAGITAIYTNDYKRTIQTAQPLAMALSIPLTSIGGVKTAEEEVKVTIARVRRREQKGVVVIVGHGNTVVMMLKALGVRQEVAVGPQEHDDLFVVIPRPKQPPTVLRLNY